MTQKTYAFDHGLYIDLDALLDTRLATLYLVHPELSLHAIASPYEERLEDAFPHVPRELFAKLYKERGIDTLQNATTTNVINFIKPIISRMILETVTTPYAKDARIWLNVYPFKLTEEEITSICTELHELTSKQIEIQPIYKTPEDLSPAWIKDNISVMIKYEYEEWLELHVDGFKKNQIPDVQLYVPKLYLHGIPTDEAIAEVTGPYGGPFELMQISASPIIGLNFMEISLYCSQVKVSNKYDITEVKES